MKEAYVLGIDIGTGSVKAVAVDYKGKAFTDSQFHYPSQTPQEGYHEQDPEVIWEACLQSVKAVITHIGHPPAAVSFSSAMHSLIAVDDAGKALLPMMTWIDSRSAAIATSIRNAADGEELYTKLGAPLYSMLPLCKIIWLKENKPEIFGKAQRFISIKEFIWWRLFHAYQVDHSIACGTGLFETVTLKWNEVALQRASLTAERLSEPVSTGYFRSDADPAILSKTGIAAGTPFVIGASDGCLANLGSFALEPGIAAITVGTSGAVRIKTDQPVFNFKAMTFSYRLDEDTFICGGPLNNGGSALQWLIKNLLNKPSVLEQDYNDTFLEIAAEQPGCSGLLFLPYLSGERAPVWDAGSSGVFLGIKSHHDQRSFSRAVVEGICYALNEIMEAVEANAGAIRQLNVSGGFVSSETWLQILADITGKKLCVIQADDASAIGAALMGLKSLHIIPDYSSVQQSPGTVIMPNEVTHLVYKGFYQVYKKVYSSLRENMHELNYLVESAKSQ